VTIRLATAVLFLAAAGVAALTPAPDELPAVALGQVAVYRVEVLLALMYGGLLLLTPLLRGVIHGQLPVEISHKGAKWPEGEADDVIESLRRKVDRLETERDMLLKSKHSNS
jgi:hypothetical protein